MTQVDWPIQFWKHPSNNPWVPWLQVLVIHRYLSQRADLVLRVPVFGAQGPQCGQHHGAEFHQMDGGLAKNRAPFREEKKKKTVRYEWRFFRAIDISTPFLKNTTDIYIYIYILFDTSVLNRWKNGDLVFLG